MFFTPLGKEKPLKDFFFRYMFGGTRRSMITLPMTFVGIFLVQFRDFSS
jgi:hypothetical protein